MIQQFHFWVYIQQNWSGVLKHSIIIHNSQEVEATQKASTGEMDKQNVVTKYVSWRSIQP